MDSYNRPRLFVMISTLMFTLTATAVTSPGVVNLNTTPIRKPYTLLLFATATYSQNAPRDGKVCAAAMQVAADTVNSRTDYLPDYNINLDFRDEAASATLAPKNFIGFLRDAEDVANKDNTSFIAPAVVGTYQGCNNLANTARVLKMVQFTPGCSGILFTAMRKKYPYLYRNRVPADTQYLMSVIYFLYEPANWTKIIILDFDGSSYMQAAVQKAGKIHTVIAQDIDDNMMKAVKKSNVRVIYVGTGNAALYTNFLCLSHKHGLRLPNYVFLTASSNFNDPNAKDLKLPEGCTVQMFTEQVSITFWGGPFDFALEPHGVTTFGYDEKGFDIMLDRLTNKSRSADYVRRHRCFDTMAQTLISLDKADRLLKQQKNIGLKDFKSDPDSVVAAVNRTAAETDFVGLRIGRIHYSSRLELDNEWQYVTQWVNGEMRVIMRIFFNGTNVNLIHELSQYAIEWAGKPKWFTKDGMAPRDEPIVEHRIDTFRVEAFAVVIVLVTVSCVAMANFGMAIFRRHRFTEDIRSKIQVTTYADTLAILGCLLSDAGAICVGLTFDATSVTKHVCTIQIASSVAGLSIIVGSVFARLLVLLRRFQRSTYRRIHVIKGTSLDSTNNNIVLAIILLYLALNFGYVIAFFIYDPVSLVKITGDAVFDESTDTYFDESRYFCDSKYLTYWVGGLGGANSFVLILAAFLSYEGRRLVAGPNLKLEFYMARTAAASALPIFGAVLFLVFTIPSSQTSLKSTILAIGTIAFANISVSITLFPTTVKSNPTTVVVDYEDYNSSATASRNTNQSSSLHGFMERHFKLRR